MEVNTKKVKLQTAIRAVRKQYHDSIAEVLVSEPTTSYAAIGRVHGVSEQFVLAVAKERGLSRNASRDEDDSLLTDAQVATIVADGHTIVQEDRWCGGHIYTKDDLEDMDADKTTVFEKAAEAING